jgi:Protein of unknown function (DUF3307)
MGLFQILLVGHLIADFPLQTPTILRWKFKGGLWVLPHVIVHAAVLILLIRNPFAVGIIVLTHFLIDWTKVALDDGSRQGLSFLMDQLAHLSVLLLVAQYGGMVGPKLAFDNLPYILVLTVISAVFMFLNVVKNQIAASPIPKVLYDHAFYVSKAAGWSAVLILLFSILILH